MFPYVTKVSKPNASIVILQSTYNNGSDDQQAEHTNDLLMKIINIKKYKMQPYKLLSIKYKEFKFNFQIPDDPQAPDEFDGSCINDYAIVDNKKKATIRKQFKLSNSIVKMIKIFIAHYEQG